MDSAKRQLRECLFRGEYLNSREEENEGRDTTLEFFEHHLVRAKRYMDDSTPPMWVEGNYIEIEPSGNLIGLSPTSQYIETYKTKPGDKREIYPIIADTLGQYTGAEDINGLKIFEGDIIKTKMFHDYWLGINRGYDGGGKHEVIGIVEYSCGYLGFALNGAGYYGRLRVSATDEAMVIGNIYDNPELVWEIKDFVDKYPDSDIDEIVSEQMAKAEEYDNKRKVPCSYGQ
ncbi:hypothetical protein FACS1894188_07670 [Clostridia bacterium]|nr:hypothetical protein FACS1894188_07670 [Clostridia bacterium]